MGLTWTFAYYIFNALVRIIVLNLSCWNNPGTGEETVNGVFRMEIFDILLWFFKAHVNPYDPTRKPFKKDCVKIINTVGHE